MSTSPPKWAERFINWLTIGGQHADIPGDLREEFTEYKLKKGLQYAHLKYIWTVLLCLRPFILQDKFSIKLNHGIMIRNYWLVTQRFILKNKLYAAINILGLAIGIGCSLVLLIYVSNELGFDRFHKEGQNIYRLLVTSRSEEGESITATITAAIAPTLKEELPEVVEFIRFSTPTNGFLSFNGKKVNIEKLVYADSSLFDVFSFVLEKGDKQSSLTLPYSILLTPKIANSLFGEENPIGQQVMLNGEKTLLVTGVIKEAPINSQIQYSCLISFSTLKKEGYFLDWNGGWNYFSYIKLSPGSDITALQSKFPALMDWHINNMLKKFQVEWLLDTQPLRNVHLGPAVEGEWSNKGNIQYIYIFGSIAIITLLMAIVNFINLTASQALARMKEIGVRKALGANKRMLVYQFLFESLIFTLIAMCLAILLIAISYNTINEFLSYQFNQMYLNNVWLALIIIVIILIVSIASGAYPAFFLSSISINSLKNNPGKGLAPKPKKVDVLVIFQFTISIILIAGTWFINNQLIYIQSKGLGYSKDNVLVVTLNSEQASKNANILKIELSKIPEVHGTGSSTDLPGDGFTSNGYFPEGHELPIMLHALDIDDTYLETMGMAIVAGRNFSNDIMSDKSAFLVNETLADQMGWKNAVGKIISRDGDHKIIGVVKDFNYASLHDKIEPLVFTMAPWKDQYNYLSIRIGHQNISSTIEKIEEAWNMVNVNDPLEFSFLDQEFDSLYYKEQNQAKLLFVFSVLAILIGSMGLFGIVSYSLKQKTKEIGVRKVLGATALNLLSEISRRYIFSIIIASSVAIPIVYIFINKWLSSFYYRIEIKPIVFLLSILIAFIIALITINVQTVTAINQNPTESLKYE